jgi:REP element-mobilizing transposase RayT
MPYDPQRHHRRSIRLPGYDYTQPGAYFVTIVTHERMPLFGDIVDGEMRLNDAGRVAEQCWLDIPSHFPHVALDAFVIMPNHVHGILWIVETPPTTGAAGTMGTVETVETVGAVGAVGAKNFSPLPPSQPSPLPPPRPSSQPSDISSDAVPRPHGTSKTIGSVVRGFKIGVTKWFRHYTTIYTVWQRNYYEHIIRDDDGLARIRDYIQSNPQRWADDQENPFRNVRR